MLNFWPRVYIRILLVIKFDCTTADKTKKMVLFDKSSAFSTNKPSPPAHKPSRNTTHKPPFTAHQAFLTSHLLYSDMGFMMKWDRSDGVHKMGTIGDILFMQFFDIFDIFVDTS